MQDDFKQKRWDELGDQSKTVPDLPFAQNNNSADIDSIVNQITNNQNNNTDTTHVNLPNNTSITYAGGVPIIHSMATDEHVIQSMANNQDSGQEINNLATQMEKEKRVKIFISVFVIVIVLFSSIVFAYIYYKNKAEQELLNSPLTINNNTGFLNKNKNQDNINNTTNINNIDSANISNNTINTNTDNNNMTGISSTSNTISANDNNITNKFTQQGLSEQLSQHIKDIYTESEDYNIIYLKPDSDIMEIKNLNLQDYENFVKEKFNIQQIEDYKDVKYKTDIIRYYSTDQYPILISMFKNYNIIISKDMRGYLSAVQYLQKK